MFAEDIKKLTSENTNFRKVLHTGTHSQIVAMSIPASGDIGEEVHPDTDQILFFVEGEGEAILSGEVRNIDLNDVVFVPAGTMHNFKNTTDRDLKLFTVYSPPHHPNGTIHKTKADAEKEEVV
ncbi:MAG: cupin domain-containing protein [Candidatus Curtissbacteria bacterium]|nr:cupin domain-containing protein [Candidatus Curtissbacteria bacterium]